MKTFVRLLIRGYQRFISPVIHAIGGPGTGCRFHPTCSQYFLEAVEMHGVLAGSWLGIKRLGRCQPWGGSGHDPVPPKKTLTSDSETNAHCACESAASVHKSPPAKSPPGQP